MIIQFYFWAQCLNDDPVLFWVQCLTFRPACLSSFRALAPHTTPISPSLPERHASRWKEKLDSFNENSVDEKMTKINFHEIYDDNEVCQDWQDMFISTAYLVWCPSKKVRINSHSQYTHPVAIQKVLNLAFTWSAEWYPDHAGACLARVETTRTRCGPLPSWAPKIKTFKFFQTLRF